MEKAVLGQANHRRRIRARRPSPELEPIDRSLELSVEQQVYRKLRSALMSGKVAAGDGISIRSIAENLDVSSAPVREALKRLEADGVLKARQKSAFYTRAPSLDEFDQVLTVRCSLEGLAAAQAAEKADELDVQRIENAANRYVQATERGDEREIISANHDYHFAIYRASRSPILVGLIENLWVRMGPVLARTSAHYDHNQALGFHGEALSAIRRRDSAAAEAAIRRDIQEAARTIRAALDGVIAAEAPGHRCSISSSKNPG